MFRFDPDSAGGACLGDACRQAVALQTIAERVPEDERAGFIGTFQHWQPGQAPIRLTHRLWNPRSSRWMDVRTIGYPSADGSLIGFSEDISRSNDSEEILSRYRTLLVTSGVFGNICYWTLDYADAVYQVSDDLVEQIGFPPGTSRIPESDFSSRIHPDDIAHTVALRRAGTRDDTATILEYRLWKATEQRWIHVRSPLFFVRDPHGKPVTMYGFTQDVTEQKEAEARLRREHQRIESAQILGRMGTWTLDLATRIFRSKAFALEMSGIPANGELEVNIEEILSEVHPDDRDALANILDRANQPIEPQECEFRRWHPTDRRWVHRRLVAQVACDVEGKPYELQGFTQDITRQKETEERLRVSASVFEHSRSLIMITDVDRRIIQVNPAFCELLGYAEHEIIGRTPDSLNRLKLTKDMWHGIIEKLTGASYFSGEIWATDRAGQDVLIAVTISAVRDSHGEIAHFIYVGEDITQQRAAEAQINQLAYYDALTRLPNRTLLREHADAALAEARQCYGEAALVFLDLDYFKNVNDSLGHAAGDQLLKEIARRLQACVGSMGMVGRLGGDEFLIIMPSVGIEPARRVAGQLAETLSQPMVIEGNNLVATSSIGIAIYPRDGDNYAELMRAADAAMYKAKQDGRGTIAEFAPLMRNKARK
ncbi:sensor domain-containing diguanylate cyclase [Cupriavidus sp. BIS7]|uniref:sensor domain-containing diguanylate cyclase n=1 Tax=Cupriavidus sp. BIS7 TaxID=1217718 RepID=UPI000474DC03|nr:sensor domain-containing diguanylate cyclase [Cupriavidus sp. BIS7]